MSAEPTYRYSLQDIERYLNGNMTTHEMHEMERAALSDPLLADAIDGFRDANPSLSAQHLNEIAALLQKNVNTDAPVVAINTPKSGWWRWAVAASLAGILGVSAWWMLKDDSLSGDQSMAVADAPAADSSILEKSNSAPYAADSALNKLDAEADKQQNLVNPPDLAEEKQTETKNIQQPVHRSADKIAATKTPAPVLLKPEEIAKDVVMEEVAPLQAEVLSRSVPGIEVKKAMPAGESPYRRAAYSANGNEGFFTGKVMDNDGNPLPGASIVSGNVATVTDQTGNFTFTLPAFKDSISHVSISAIGFEGEKATLFAGRKAGIALQPANNNLTELVIIGKARRKDRASSMGVFNQMKVDTLQSMENPYPDGGWANFYDDLVSELGINRSKANKLLHLKFFIEEDGKPTDFTVIKTPDMAVADRAIAAIKKGPRWKNIRKRKSAEVKMNVE